MTEKYTLKTLIFNCRSIRDYYKKIMLIDILRSNEIDIALLQETFLIEEDKFYIEGYKIYRADNQIRRKGVAILINTKLDVECIKLATDPNGRYIKVRMKNRENGNSTTISSIYIEPEGTILDINEVALESDIIGGDLNKADSGLHTKGVFHFKNIRITDELDLKNRDILDHPILIGETDFATWKIPEKEKIIILDKEKVLI